ncbi:MAG: hypothetical protein HN929_13975 [Chloroflexi bacterium]|nr:hypothetical protein [Chloroflexota bacterium]
MTPQELATLDQLALAAGRTKAATVRRLLTLAETPEARRLLGEPPNHKQEVTA